MIVWLIIFIALSQDTSHIKTYTAKVIEVKAKMPLSYLQNWPIDYREIRLSSVYKLSKIPGIFLKDYLSFGSIAIRASSSEEIGFSIEGLPVGSPQNGYFDLKNLPDNFLAKVEIVKTPFSAFYGQGAMAGWLNIFLPAPGNGFRAFYGNLARGFSIFKAIYRHQMAINTGFAFEKGASSFRTDYCTGRQILIKNGGYEKFGLFSRLFYKDVKFLLLSAYHTRGIPLIPNLSNNKDSLKTFTFLLGTEYKNLSSALYLENLLYLPENHEFARHLSGMWSLKLKINRFEILPKLEFAKSSSIGFHKRVLIHTSFKKVLLIPGFETFLISGVSFTQKQALFSGLIGLQLKKRLFFNFSSGSRLPTFNELFWPEDRFAKGNPALKPEHLISVEGGLKKEQIMNLNLYYRHYKNLITWIPLNGKWQPENLKELTVSGVEFTINGKITEFLKVQAFLSFSKILKGQHPVYLPDTVLGISVSLKDMLDLSIEHIGERPERPAGPKKLKALNVFSLQVSKEFVKTKVTFELREIFSKTPCLIRGYPIPQRVWLLKISKEV